MDIAVSHSSFIQQRLTIRTAGLFSGPRVLLNSLPIKRDGGKYIVRNDSGTEVTVRLKSTFFDSIPTLTLDDTKVSLARSLTWYEYLWISVPILLLFIGGALGGGIGVFATYSNSRIIRSDRSTISKYALTGAASICAFVAFFVVATALQLVMVRAKH